jgi:hypothetical protein
MVPARASIGARSLAPARTEASDRHRIAAELPLALVGNTRLVSYALSAP